MTHLANAADTFCSCSSGHWIEKPSNNIIIADQFRLPSLHLCTYEKYLQQYHITVFDLAKTELCNLLWNYSAQCCQASFLLYGCHTLLIWSGGHVTLWNVLQLKNHFPGHFSLFIDFVWLFPVVTKCIYTYTHVQWLQSFYHHCGFYNTFVEFLYGFLNNNITIFQKNNNLSFQLFALYRF